MIQSGDLDTFFTEMSLWLDSHRLQPIALLDLDAFCDGLAYRLEVFQSAKKQMDRYIASDFSVFSYIGVDEKLLSKILRDLLDPNGSHGQGDAFLREFLRLIGWETAFRPGDVVTVSQEIYTTTILRSARRLDLLIDIHRNGQSLEGIAIENKPWAPDQEDQIDDYLRHLGRSYSEGHYCIIYLTRNGALPSPYSVSNAEELCTQRKLRLMAYATGTDNVYSLLEWLDTCHQVCQSERIRWFLRDLIQYIQRNLPYELAE